MHAVQPLRPLICVDSLGLGGKERQAVALIRGLIDDPRVEPHVVCFDRDDFYLDNLRDLALSIDFIVRRVRWDVGVFQQLGRIVRRYKPGLIHTNGLVSSFYSLPFAKYLHIPLINGSIRNAFAAEGLRWQVERLLLLASEYRLANSRAGLQSRGLAAGDPRNVVIYNGFDFNRLARITRDAPARMSDVADTARVVGMVAEFSEYKDYATYIEAARIIGRKRRDVLFLAVGDGNTLDACQEAAADLENIRFLGRQKNVEALVKRFEVGVLCTFVEGISNSIMEYMALGKPVVATEGGGTSELIEPGITGLLVRPRDPEELASAIEWLVDNPDIAARMGAEGAARLRREFAFARMIDETVALYARAAAHSRHPALVPVS